MQMTGMKRGREHAISIDEIIVTMYSRAFNAAKNNAVHGQLILTALRHKIYSLRSMLQQAHPEEGWATIGGLMYLVNRESEFTKIDRRLQGRINGAVNSQEYWEGKRDELKKRNLLVVDT